MTALRAASLRSSADIAAALAGPPFFPPLRPRATAAGFFRLFISEEYLSAHEKTSCIIRERSRILILMMNTRETRAIEIADKFRIVNEGSKWFVPSQTGGSKYAVRILNDRADCTCPDFELRRDFCKHILAVQLVIKR